MIGSTSSRADNLGSCDESCQEFKMTMKRIIFDRCLILDGQKYQLITVIFLLIIEHSRCYPLGSKIIFTLMKYEALLIESKIFTIVYKTCSKMLVHCLSITSSSLVNNITL